MKKLNCFLILGIFYFSISAQACIHVPLDYSHEVTYDTEEIFMYHDGKYAHMIIKPTIQVQSEDLPKTVGWIIPVQSVPVDYKESDPKIFNALFAYVEQHKPQQRMYRGLTDGNVSQGVILHEKQFVGRYEIQPIELTDYTSGKELLDWLNLNGFKTKNKDISYYLIHHYSYLAIKISNLQNKKEELKPLHIVYKSDELSVPLKFDSLSGVFNVNIYFLTNKEITDKDMFNSKHLNLDGEWDSPIEFIPGKNGDNALDSANLLKGYIYKFKGYNINSSSNQLKDWSEDPNIKI